MIGITIVIIIAFGWFFTPGNRSSRNAPGSGIRIYGRTYTQEELERRGRSYQVAMLSGLNELVIGLTLGNPYSEQAATNFVLDSFVLDHEAQALSIAASDNEVAAAIESLPPFQTQGAFDHLKYQNFIDNALKPRGFTNARFEALVRDQLRLKKLVALLGGTVEITPGEFRAQYVQSFQKINVSLARLDLAEFKAAVHPTDEEIAKVFKDREKTYTSPEKRVVSYVRLDLTDAEKALKGKELMEARQNLANRANDLGQDLLKENASFPAVAQKYGLKVETTPGFTEANPPEAFAAVPQAAAAAFKLTDKDPNSDALPVGNGYVILHLEKVTPSRQLTFEEAKPQIIEQIKAEKAHSALVSKGNELRAKIAESLKSGKPFADAAQEAGLKVETLPAFSPAEPLENKPNSQEILGKAVELADGDLSDFTPVAGGGFILHLDKRDPINEEQFKKEETTRLASANERKGLITFIDWLGSRRKQANIQLPRGRGEAAAE